MSLSRRRFLRAGTAVGLGAISATTFAATSKVRLLIIGGGFAGATAARFLKRLIPAASVTLVDSRKHYEACPMSNLVVTGQRPASRQRFSYGALAREGIHVVNAKVDAIDTHLKTARLGSGKTLSCDRLVLAPGIDLRTEKIDGSTADTHRIFPHAWRGGEQSQRLFNQLSTMPDGGLVVICVPAAPFRCPPGPYERASLIAGWLANHRPRSKLIILDANESFSKQSLFTEFWQSEYPGLIEWRSASNDGVLDRVDPVKRKLFTVFEELNPAVCNLIPPQSAGGIARRAKLTDSTGWCQVNPVTFASDQASDVHIIGDAINANPMPKSAFAANAQAKICAYQIARSLYEQAPLETKISNTCYSLLTPDQAVSISSVYRLTDNGITTIPATAAMSPGGKNRALRAREAAHAYAWFGVITGESFNA